VRKTICLELHWARMPEKVLCVAIFSIKSIYIKINYFECKQCRRNSLYLFYFLSFFMQLITVDQLKMAAESKTRHRQMLEQIKQQRLRALQQLEQKIDKIRLEETMLQKQIRQLQQQTIQEALCR
jgi:cell division protein FtsB